MNAPIKTGFRTGTARRAGAGTKVSCAPTCSVGARRAVPVPEQKFHVPLPLKIGLCAFGLIAATLSSAEPLGRLFFTPEQRAQLEHSKPQSSSSTGSGMTVNGIVQKHGGKRTVWINGVPRQAGNSDELAPDSLPVAVPGLTKPVKVKVGQKVRINPASDTGQ